MQSHTHKCSHKSSIESTNRMRTLELMDVKEENCTTKTLTFQDQICKSAEPGQFLMVWIPGVDEIPISLSGISSDGITSITVNAVGDATNALNQKKKGDIIGIRGPFGNGFVPVKGNVMVIGGGTGLGPMMPLTEKLVGLSSKITVMSGVKCQENLLFLDRIAELLCDVDSETICTTEDGSYGFEGLVTSQLEKKLANEKVDMIYSCGPEPMMYHVFRLAEQYNVPVQASLERIMRCGIGLCGSCVIGEIRVCKDGPVLTSEQLRSIKDEFGKSRLDWTGKKVKQ